MRCHSAAVAWLLLAGCASTPKAEPLPALVKVPVLEYVRVPDKLTAPCPVTRAKSRTVEAVVSAYNAHVTALEACNANQIGRAHVCTPVTNAHLVCRILLEKKTTYR